MEVTAVRSEPGTVPQEARASGLNEQPVGAAKKKRRKSNIQSIRKSNKQKEILQCAFSETSKPSSERLIELSAETCLSHVEVSHWFRNQRQKAKKASEKATATVGVASADTAPSPASSNYSIPGSRCTRTRPAAYLRSDSVRCGACSTCSLPAPASVALNAKLLEVLPQILEKPEREALVAELELNYHTARFWHDIASTSVEQATLMTLDRVFNPNTDATKQASSTATPAGEAAMSMANPTPEDSPMEFGGLGSSLLSGHLGSLPSDSLLGVARQSDSSVWGQGDGSSPAPSTSLPFKSEPDTSVRTGSAADGLPALATALVSLFKQQRREYLTLILSEFAIRDRNSPPYTGISCTCPSHEFANVACDDAATPVQPGFGHTQSHGGSLSRRASSGSSSRSSSRGPAVQALQTPPLAWPPPTRSVPSTPLFEPSLSNATAASSVVPGLSRLQHQPVWPETAQFSHIGTRSSSSSSSTTTYSGPVPNPHTNMLLMSSSAAFSPPGSDYVPPSASGVLPQAFHQLPLTPSLLEFPMGGGHSVPGSAIDPVSAAPSHLLGMGHLGASAACTSPQLASAAGSLVTLGQSVHSGTAANTLPHLGLPSSLDWAATIQDLSFDPLACHDMLQLNGCKLEWCGNPGG